MKQTFKLEKGEILFEEDKIIIKDDAKKQKWYGLLITFMGTMILISFFLKAYKTVAMFELWFELTFILIGIPLLIILLLRSTKSEITFNEVKSMKIKKIFGNNFLYIKLVNNRLRRVSDIQNAKELEKYIVTNFNTK
jgi:uncharacterized membrane protein YhdT